MKNIKGFTIVEAVLIVAIVAVIGGLGWVYYSRTNSTTANSTVPASVTEITSTSDIESVTTQLDSINLDTDISSELDSLTQQLNSF